MKVFKQFNSAITANHIYSSYLAVVSASWPVRDLNDHELVLSKNCSVTILPIIQSAVGNLAVSILVNSHTEWFDNL